MADLVQLALLALCGVTALEIVAYIVRQGGPL